MAKSKRHLSRRNKVSNLQIVYSESKKVLIEQYLSPKGDRLLKEGKITKEVAWEKYGKNRYRDNPDAKPVKMIVHK